MKESVADKSGEEGYIAEYETNEEVPSEKAQRSARRNIGVY